MPAEIIRFRLVGDRPLLMHSSRLADPLDPIAIDLKRLTKKRAKVEADFAEISKVEWFGGLWLSDGIPCVPSEAIETCFVAAARTRRLGRTARAGFMVSQPAALVYDGPRSIDLLWGLPAFRFRFPVQVAGVRTMRTRPRFADWSAEIEAEFLPSLIRRDDVIDMLHLAGALEGLGDWRPRFGRFRIELD